MKDLLHFFLTLQEAPAPPRPPPPKPRPPPPVENPREKLSLAEQAELMLRESENEEEDDTDEDIDEIEQDAKIEEQEMPSKSWNVSAFSNPSVKKTQSLNCKRPEQLRQHQTPSNTPLSRYALPLAIGIPMRLGSNLCHPQLSPNDPTAHESQPKSTEPKCESEKPDSEQSQPRLNKGRQPYGGPGICIDDACCPCYCNRLIPCCILKKKIYFLIQAYCQDIFIVSHAGGQETEKHTDKSSG